MSSIRQIAVFTFTLLAIWSVVPLMVWAGTGSWRRALQALREYLGVLGIFALAGGGLGVSMILAAAIG